MIRLASLTAAAVLAAGSAAAQAGPPPALDVTLTPKADAIDVELKIQAPEASPDKPLLRLPMVFASVRSARYEAADLHASDDKGPLPLVQADDPADPSNFLYFRRWKPGRATVGDVTVRYQAPAEAFIPKLGSGPPFDLRPEASGLNGAGVTFMAVPDRSTPYRIHLKWDLKGLPPGSRGAWSVGEGEVRTVGPVELLANAYYMAGPIKSEPADSTGPFAIYWLSEPNFDISALSQFTVKAYKAISEFFGEPDKPYRVFFRRNAVGGNGGAGLVNSFMAGYGDSPAPTAESIRGYLAHEIVHNWPGGLDGKPGVIAWYGEGLAERYSTTIPWRSGLFSTDDYLKAVNAHARSYFGNPVNTAPAEEIAAKFWSDTRVRKLPYDRGFFYFAIVDAQLRAKSGGKQRVDALVHEMLARRKRGQSYDTDAWLEIVTRELGPQAKADYEAMMAGKLQVAPSDAFGPCFKREPAKYAGFELGFDSASLAASPRVVRGLVAGSAAARAGVREGDEITEAVVLDPFQADDTLPLTLKLKRGGQPLQLTYLPRGAEVDGYRWVRTDGVADSACGI